jgi:hypothetical protein
VPVQGSLVENDHVVEALAANRADDAFHVGTLPRGSLLINSAVCIPPAGLHFASPALYTTSEFLGRPIG